ncbi:MAG TPA: sigma-70 family RNA polymerase sigma factor [Kofleriaceae bacterium]|nr:sigma-70 family RNA polymerase sigma factor [Kofleriaceae bacterium]
MSDDPPGGAGALTGFAGLAAQHRGYLLRIATRLSGSADVADDLVQDTLLRAFRRFEQFQPGTHASAWLATILTNLYLDSVKHQRVVRDAEPSLVATTELLGSPPMAELTDAELYAAIDALEPELRKVVDLCYLQQLGYRAAAAVLGVPVGTVGTRLMRARAWLREHLTAREDVTS